MTTSRREAGRELDEHHDPFLVARARNGHTVIERAGQIDESSEAFIPTLQGWQVGLFNGAASFNFPIDVPAGPARLRRPSSLRR